MKIPFHRGGLRFWLVITALVVGQSSMISILLGILPLLLGVMLYVRAKGCLRQNLDVARAGPYRYVRHPYYLANALIDTSIAVMSGWWLLPAVLPVWWLCVYVPVIRSEERHLASLFPEDYPAYRKRVPMLVPWRWPLPVEKNGFSWQNINIARGRVLSQAVRFLAYPLLFVVVSGIREKRFAFFTENHGLGASALTFLLLVYGLAWFLALHRKHRRRILPESLSTTGVRAIFGGALLVAATFTTVLETEFQAHVWGTGLFCLAFSLVVYHLRLGPRAGLVAEGATLTAACILCKVIWLAPLPILYHAALWLDAGLPGSTTDAARHRPETPRRTAIERTSYYAFLVATILAAVLKKTML